MLLNVIEHGISALRHNLPAPWLFNIDEDCGIITLAADAEESHLMALNGIHSTNKKSPIQPRCPVADRCYRGAGGACRRYRGAGFAGRADESDAAARF